MSRQRKELERRVRLEVKKVKIKRRALKVKKLTFRARRMIKFLRTGQINFLRTGQMKFLRPVRKKNKIEGWFGQFGDTEEDLYL